MLVLVFMVCFCTFNSSEVLTTSAVLVLDDTISIFEKRTATCM